jgi:hypothetical protein
MCANVKHFAHNETNDVYSPGQLYCKIGIVPNEKSFQYESDISPNDINNRTHNCPISIEFD